jgi:hypothetical protein
MRWSPAVRETFLRARSIWGGPPAMIDAMVRLLLKSRVKRSQIRFDKFA